MQVIRQNDDRIHLEGMLFLDFAEGDPQFIDMLHQQAIAFTFGEIDREKPCRTGDVSTAVLRHLLR